MELYEIKESTKDEEDLVWKGIIQYNSAVIHLNQSVSEIPVNRVLKNKDGNVIGGINCILFYCWNTLYIDMLWISENHRKSGHGSKLLN